MEYAIAVLVAFITVLFYFSFVFRKGIAYFLHYSVSYAYLTFENTFRKKRFDLYDFCAVSKPKKNGFFIPKEEWVLDMPLRDPCFRKHADTAFMFGTNSKSEYLAIHVCRRSGHKAQCSLFLRMSDGKLYILPEKHTIQRETSEQNTFGSSRLKLQCLLPMRKWRIFFNGMLEEKQENQDSDLEVKYKHVQFTFIWTASSEVFDFSSDFSKSLLSHTVASYSWLNSPISSVKKLKKILDAYEQPGMILGTIAIENKPEKEMYLWGARRRYMGKNKCFRHGISTQIYGNFKNGSIIHFGILKKCGIFKKFLYGYLMKPNGFIFPMEELYLNNDEIGNEDKNITFCADNKWYKLSMKCKGNDTTFLNRTRKRISIQTVNLNLDGREGRGFLFRGNEKGLPDCIGLEDSLNNWEDTREDFKHASPIYCIPFNDKLCPKSELCGGKGSSLGNLYASSKLQGLNLKFSVPLGFVVSSDAYAAFMKGSLEESLKKFEKDVWTKIWDIPALCRRMEDKIIDAVLPANISQSITKEMESVFGSSFYNRTFAIRSSATSEDTEQMSAAGQMETYLGIKGMDQILHSVKKCWASQFSFRAVEYKRGYGQPLNTPMAVVIQEMVACEAAGVIFTCDPVTGNPSSIHITANWGLGESVVSASADPDTVTINRGIDDEISILLKQVGKKTTKIIMDDDSRITETKAGKNETSICCISDDMALQLSRIAIEIEKHSGNPRDIEWGIKDGDIFLFQSRPVTTLVIETEFETKHMFDTYQRLEKSFWTKANVGEVMPGVASSLSIDVLQKVHDIVQKRATVQMSKGFYPHTPYYQKVLVYAFNHTFLNLVGGFFSYDEEHKAETNSFIIALFGRLIDLTDLRKASTDVIPQLMTPFKEVLVGIYFLTMSFVSGINLRMRSEKIKSVEIPCANMNSLEILHQIGKDCDVAAEGMACHTNCTLSSSFWNMSTLSFLAKLRGEWDNVVFSDFAHLLSTCDNVESADVPAAIQELGIAISREIPADDFKKMSLEESLNWLNNNSSEARNKFQQFLRRHGHRCLKEFDIYTETWSSNPKPLIKMLQNFVNKNPLTSANKAMDSFSSIVSKLHIQLKFKDRLRLRWLLPNVRRAVRDREQSKSLCIYTINTLRKPFHRLSEIMVEEGRLPAKELLFFLSVGEIEQLIETRSPRLVSKAIRRHRVHKELDKMIFPEICIDIPKPINNEDVVQVSAKGHTMIGVPVGQGVVKAPARVVMNLEEATTIQQGDILITYSTDIGWSPYFPLLSGVATELGGLISHGAVVAREYGLPCVVSLHGATRVFKSGDLVILDGSKGTLQKVEEN